MIGRSELLVFLVIATLIAIRTGWDDRVLLLTGLFISLFCRASDTTKFIGERQGEP